MTNEPSFLGHFEAQHPASEKSEPLRILAPVDGYVLKTSALFRRGNGWMAFAVKEGKARLCRVEIVHNNGIAAEVRSGLSQGDAVIIHPPDAIHDGAPVASW